MPTLVIVRGLPLSGKTRWCESWVEKKQNRLRVSWTDVLHSMGRGPGKLFKPLAVDAACRLMCQAFRAGCDVVLDECNLNGAELAPFITRAALMYVPMDYVTIRAGIDEIKKRNAQLGHPVNDMVIERMAERYALLLKE